MEKTVVEITKDFDYSKVGHFHHEKLDGIVSVKKIGLPLVDIYFINPSVYRQWKAEAELALGFNATAARRSRCNVGTPPLRRKRRSSAASHEEPPSLRAGGVFIKELEKVAKLLLAKYGLVTLRTCFKFVGLENPRGLLSWRNLKSPKSILTSVKSAFNHGEEVAKKNKISQFELGLILMGRISAEKGGIIVVDIEKEKLCSIEACWGDARLIVMGEGEWDTFLVNENLKILGREIGDKEVGYFFKGSDRKKIKVPKKKRRMPSLDDEEVVKLAKLSFKAACFHQANIEIEFMINKEGVLDMYELQVEPGIKVSLRVKKKTERGVLIKGLGTCLGKVKGRVRLIKKDADLEKINEGEIVVMHLPKADACLPIFTKAKAIITDKGGTTSHFATIARDFHVPCVVGTERATKVLKNGMMVIVDACKGEVRLSE